MKIQKLKILFLLSSLKKKEFFYSFKKRDFWIRVVTAIAVVYLVLNSISSSSFLVQFIKDNFHLSSTNFIPIFNIVLFFVFLCNIAAIIFLGTANYDQSFIKIFLRFPISLKQIIFFRTISVSSELVNIIFLPLYISAYFIAGNSINFTGVLVFLLVLLLFLLCLNSLIEFLRNITSAIISLKKYKNIFWFLTFVFTLFIIVIIPKIFTYFTNQESIKKISDVLFYFPTGVFTKSLFSLNGNITVSQLYLYIFYFVLLGVMLFAANLLLVKFYKNRDFGKVNVKSKLTRPKVSNFIHKIKLGAFEEKNLIYLFRGPRPLLNAFGFIFIEIYLVYFATAKVNDGTIKNIYVLFSIIIYLQSLIIIANAANFFAYDYSGIINYFFRPLKIRSFINSKILIVNIFTIINTLSLIYLGLLLKLNAIDIVLQFDLLFFTYLVFLIIAIIISFYFPKVVGFYSIMGMNMSILSVIIGIIFAMAFWGLDYLLLTGIKFITTKLVIIFLIFLINLTIINFKEKIFALFNKILIKQKEKIIDVCL